MKTTVTIPVEEYEALKGLVATVATLTAQLAKQQEQLAWLNKQVFGQKSERLKDLPCDTPDIPGLEIPVNEESEPETTTVPEHKRKKTKRKTDEFKFELPDDLEEVEVHLDPPEEERTLPDGRKLVRMNEERVKKLAFRPAEYYAKVFVKGIWTLPGDEFITPVQAPMPDDLSHGGKLDVSFLAHLAVEKFCFHMPVYRIQEKLDSRNIQASRQFLTQNLGRSGAAVIPLTELMEQRILDSGVIFTDDTPVKLQDKGKCKEARIWTYIGGKPPDGINDPPYIVYKFSEDRSYDHPRTFLEEFSGLLHGDAFGAYEELGAAPDRDITWLACMAHARRKHIDAQTADPIFRRWLLRHIRYLYMFEKIAWKGKPEERLRIRNTHERPVMDKIFARLKEEARRPGLLPKSNAAKAVKYMLKREDNFRYYLDHAEARIDNNISERSIRKLTLGRKNWMFFGSDAAAEKQMALLSLIQTCRHLGIKPQEYLEDIFSRILTHPASRLSELLPDAWKARRETQA